MAKTPTPCIGVCTFRRPGPAGAHCIACSMTKGQKTVSKRARKASEADGFLALVMAQQRVMGHYGHWRKAFVERCVRKGRPVPEALRRDAAP